MEIIELNDEYLQEKSLYLANKKNQHKAKHNEICKNFMRKKYTEIKSDTTKYTEYMDTKLVRYINKLPDDKKNKYWTKLKFKDLDKYNRLVSKYNQLYNLLQ